MLKTPNSLVSIPQFVHYFEDETLNFHQITIKSGFEGPNHPPCIEHESSVLKYPNFIIPAHHRSITTPSGDVILTGGVDLITRKSISKAYQFNPMCKHLELIEPMISPRSSHGMVYHDGYVYVVGGNTYGGIDYGEVATPTCERFCVSFKKKWTPVAELNCPAKEPCVVAYKQNILKFGGK